MQVLSLLLVWELFQTQNVYEFYNSFETMLQNIIYSLIRKVGKKILVNFKIYVK